MKLINFSHLNNIVDQNSQILSINKKLVEQNQSVIDQNNLILNLMGNKINRNFSNKNIPLKKRKYEKISSPIIDNQIDKENRMKKLKTDDLTSVSKLYRKIEIPSLKVIKNGNSFEGHLYPSDNVRNLYDLFLKNNSTHTTFADYVESNYLDKISIEKDTTLYLSEDFKMKHKLVTIKSGYFYRDNKIFHTKNAKKIFVVDENNNLFVADKRREDKNGRIHHTSLSEGKPVVAAGHIKIKYERNQRGENVTKCIINNESGHYQPSAKSLNYMLDWFKNNNIIFDVKADQNIQKNKLLIREITLETKSYKKN